MAQEKMPQAHIPLLLAGLVLFLLGLLTGLLPPLLINPRMGLSSHLEGILNGFFLAILGLIWPYIALRVKGKKLLAILAVYGSYINWLTTLAAAYWGAGSTMMPLAGLGHQGSVWQERLITFGLVSLSIAMILVSVMIIWGLISNLRRKCG